MERINESTFFDCKNAEGTLTIPSSIKIIEANAFYRCFKLSGLVFAGNSKVQTILDGAFFCCNNVEGPLVIPNSVNEIKNSAFEKCYLFESITIGSGVSDIGVKSFSECGKNLCSLHFLSNFNNIDSEAFARKTFGNITYEGNIPPNCSYDANDLNNQVNVPSDYTGKSFCGIFFPTEIFTESSKFTQTSQFTMSPFFTPSNEFTKSSGFSPSKKFTSSSHFTSSKEFTKSCEFTPSKEVISSSFFSSSDKFTPSNKKSKSELFTPSSVFTPSFTFSPERTKFPDGVDNKDDFMKANVSARNKFFNNSFRCGTASSYFFCWYIKYKAFSQRCCASFLLYKVKKLMKSSQSHCYYVNESSVLLYLWMICILQLFLCHLVILHQSFHEIE